MIRKKWFSLMLITISLLSINITAMDNDCVACTESLEGNVKQLTCGHTLHEDCIAQIVGTKKYENAKVYDLLPEDFEDPNPKHKGKCPICNHDISDKIKNELKDKIELFKNEKQIFGDKETTRDQILQDANYLAGENAPVITQNNINAIKYRVDALSNELKGALLSRFGNDEEEKNKQNDRIEEWFTPICQKIEELEEKLIEQEQPLEPPKNNNENNLKEKDVDEEFPIPEDNFPNPEPNNPQLENNQENIDEFPKIDNENNQFPNPNNQLDNPVDNPENPNEKVIIIPENNDNKKKEEEEVKELDNNLNNQNNGNDGSWFWPLSRKNVSLYAASVCFFIGILVLGKFFR